jgi:hypothetical protein
MVWPIPLGGLLENFNFLCFRHSEDILLFLLK